MGVKKVGRGGNSVEAEFTSSLASQPTDDLDATKRRN
jgi:hypothetical protein